MMNSGERGFAWTRWTPLWMLRHLVKYTNSRRLGDNATLSVRRLMEFRESVRALLGINPCPVFSLTLNYTYRSRPSRWSISGEILIRV